MSTWSVALSSILMSVAAQFSLKFGMADPAVRAALERETPVGIVYSVFSNLFVLLGFTFYGLGAVLWLKVLAEWDVSKAYPLVGIGFALAVSVGWFAGEEISIQRALGVTLVCAGVLLVGRS